MSDFASTPGQLHIVRPTTLAELDRKRTRTRLLYALLIILVVIRFFTETFPIFPRFFNFADLAVLPVAVWALLKNGWRLDRCRLWRDSLRKPVWIFGVWVALSSMVNLVLYGNRLIPAVAFLVFHLEPLLFAAAFIALGWSRRDTNALCTAIIFLGVLQLPVALFELPLALRWGDPDLASGTFGTNGSQMCFFLVLVMGYILGRYLMDKRRHWLLLLVPLVALFYAQGFKAMWFAFPLDIGIVLVLVVPGSLKRRVALLAIVLVSVALLAMPLARHTSKWTMAYVKPAYIMDFVESPYLWKLGKIQSFADIWLLYKQAPLAPVLGVGPGSYSSRAFQTFVEPGPGAINPNNVTAKYITPIPPGHFAQEFVIPLMYRSVPAFGSTTIDGPFSSYVSLLAEVGLVGFFIYLLIYYRVYLEVLSVLKRAWAERDSELAGLCLAAVLGIISLSEMAFLDNWFEVSRVTVLLWLLIVAVTLQSGKDRAARE
jgi:hypothetical protein